MKLGFVGSGKMATALVQGVLDAGAFAAADLIVTDRYVEAAEALGKKCGVRVAGDGAELASVANVIMLCVKPGDAAQAIESIRDGVHDKLLISIMAGVTIARLRDLAGPRARVVRVMPNTPALIHKGAAAFALGEGATPGDAAVVESIFSAVGKVARVEEKLLDAVTGLSGSGPAYVYVVVEALADAGVLMGLPRELAVQLAAQTVAGAAEMVLQTGMHPAQLEDIVASPGGTTIAGLEALEAAGVRSAFLSAVRAATERSRELGAQG